MIVQRLHYGICQFLNHERRVLWSMALCLCALSLIPFKASAVLQDSVWVVTFTPGEALESRLKKAAHVRPGPAQIKWMERGQNAFMHYGMNTFHQDDWGTGSEPETDFAPSAQNPDQWAQVLKNAKFSMVVPTVKHHDGFCIWNTAMTSHCIKNATVKTDVIDALHKGCVNHGVDLGIYLSPWDMNQRDHDNGLWRTSGYNAYFINQLKELLGGNYGPIGECWFDGACGDEPTFYAIPWYTPNVWYDTIEALQPMSVIRMYDGFYFSGTGADSSDWVAIKQGTKKLQWRGKEIRWCGNEGGSGRSDEWCVQPVFERFFGSDEQNGSLGQESFYSNAAGAVWYQSEVNTSIGAHWFWHSQDYSLVSLASLKTIYYNSIGNDANLLLNLIADNRGLIVDDQIALLKNWDNWIDSTFTKNWANGATATATAAGGATAEAPGHEADKIIDNKRHTYWTTGGTWNIGSSTATVTFKLPSAQSFDHIMIKEYVYDGQRVAGWSADYLDAGSNTWKSLVSGKKVIGYKRICKFNQVTSSQVRLNITRSWDNPEISNFALYRTLSGIDTTQEDTSHISTAIAPCIRAQTISIRPKIAVMGNSLTVDAAGLRIGRIDVVRMDGRSVPLSVVPGSKSVSRTLTPGVYLVKIQAGDKTYNTKIAVSR